MLGATPIFWRSGPQGFVTLSTAESEVTEIEGMIAGKAAAVIINEVYGHAGDQGHQNGQQPAVPILRHGGQSWRTRHLRLRAPFARHCVVAGEWMIQHVPGEMMIANIGTKALTAARLELLKKLMGIGPVEAEGQKTEDQKGKRKTGQLAAKNEVRLSQAAHLVRLSTFAASIAVSNAEEKKEGLEPN